MHQDVIHADMEEMSGSGVDWGRLAGARVLVTGGTGLVGAYVVEALTTHHRYTGESPTAVVMLARDVDAARHRFAHIPVSQLEIVRHDLRSAVEVGGPVDYVVHGASAASPATFAQEPVGSYIPNVIGTHHLLALAAAKGARGFLYLSSGAAQGSGLPETFDEDTFGTLDPMDPYAVYAESKRMGETMCAAWWRQHGLRTSTVRLGHTYGPGLRRDDSRAFAQFVYSALDGQDIVLYSSGADRRDFCYLTDSTVGILTCLLSGQPGTAYLLVNTDGSLTIRELAELVVRLAPVKGLRVVTDAGVPESYVAPPGPYAHPDTSRIRSLGWEPRVSPEEGFRRTMQAHRRAGDGPAPSG